MQCGFKHTVQLDETIIHALFPIQPLNDDLGLSQMLTLLYFFEKLCDRCVSLCPLVYCSGLHMACTLVSKDFSSGLQCWISFDALEILAAEMFAIVPMKVDCTCGAQSDNKITTIYLSNS